MAGLRTRAETAAAWLREQFPDWRDPAAMVQLGPGFTGAGLFDEELGAVPLAGTPGLPAAATAAAGAAGPEWRLGRCGEVQVLLVTGRHYLYEGGGPEPCVLPVCAAALAGIPDFILVDAGGGIREEFKPGTWVLLTDCINNLGASPLIGNPDLGPDPFPDMNDAFSQALNAEVVNGSAAVGLTFRLGAAQINPGPQFDSPLEVAAARRNGADLIGNGLILETIALRALRRRVTGLLLSTCLTASYAARPPTRQDVLEASRYCSARLMRGLRRCLRSGLDVDGALA